MSVHVLYMCGILPLVCAHLYCMYMYVWCTVCTCMYGVLYVHVCMVYCMYMYIWCADYMPVLVCLLIASTVMWYINMIMVISLKASSIFQVVYNWILGSAAVREVHTCMLTHQTRPGHVARVPTRPGRVAHVPTRPGRVARVPTRPDQAVWHVCPPDQAVWHMCPPDQAVWHVCPPDQAVWHMCPRDQTRPCGTCAHQTRPCGTCAHQTRLCGTCAHETRPGHAVQPKTGGGSHEACRDDTLICHSYTRTF